MTEKLDLRKPDLTRKPDDALQVMVICYLSYLKSKASIIKRADYDYNHMIGEHVYSYELIERDGMAALIVEFEDKVVCAFRGTDDVKDWAFNLDTRHTSLGEFQAVHRGFYRALALIKKEVDKYLNTSGVCEKELIIAGHSLGGAMAHLYAYECNLNFNRKHHFSLFNTKVYTFGQPRLFYKYNKYDGIVDAADNITYWRFISGDDIVPHVPSILQGYKHTKAHVFYLDKYRDIYNPNQLRMFGKWLKRTFTFKRGLEHLLTDHNPMTSYVERLKR